MAANDDQEDIDKILASMDDDDGESVSDDNVDNVMATAETESESTQADESSPPDAAPASDTSQKKEQAKKAASAHFKSVFNHLSTPLLFVGQTVQRRMERFPLKFSFQMQFLGFASMLFVLSCALGTLYYISPQNLSAYNIELSSQVLDVPAMPSAIELKVEKDHDNKIHDTATTHQEHSETDSDHSTPKNIDIPLKAAVAPHGNEAPYDFYRVKDMDAKTQNKARISIIINDIGLNQKQLVNVFANAPSMTTLSFSPYSDLSALPAKKEDVVFEYWMNLATEKRNRAYDPGVLGMYNSRDIRLNNNALTSVINKNSAFTGFVIPPHSAFPKAEAQYATIIDRIYKLGYGIADASFTAIPPNIMTMGGKDYPYFQIDVQIDAVLSPDQISANFRKLEVIAEQNKKAIGIMAGYPLTIKLYKQWAETLDERGFVLVPLSSLFKKTGATHLQDMRPQRAAPKPSDSPHAAPSHH